MRHRLTLAMIALNVAVFELVFSMPERMMDGVFEAFAFNPAAAAEVWRLATSMFLHASASHLFFNMLGLYFFGSVLEDSVKPSRWLAVYFLSGVAGSLVYAFFGSVPAVGASGCIFGLMGTTMMLKPKETVKLYVFPLPLGLIAILYALTQVALSAVPQQMASVAYTAHIGGLAAGFLFSFLFNARQALRGLLVLLLIAVVLFAAFPIFGLLIGIGEVVLDVFDFVVGLLLYGFAKLVLSGIWAAF
jgi:rhomboid protease GluP